MTLLLALFLAVSPIEQSYGPYSRPANGGDVAIAPANGHALLAWSEANRIRIALLDSRAQLISEVHDLPATTTHALANAPVAAFDGKSFFIAWNERIGAQDQTWGIFADAAGTPLGVPQRYGLAEPFLMSPPMRLLWDGSAYRLWNGHAAFGISREGAIASWGETAAPHGVAFANGVLATTTGVIPTWCLHGGCAPFMISWTVGNLRGAELLPGSGGPFTTSPITIAPAGKTFALAWTTRDLVSCSIIHEGWISWPVPASGADIEFAPGLACDDERCLLAYTHSNDVHALAFPINRLPGPEHLTIAAAERNEHAPQVFLLAAGRFLITYRSDGADGARLNGRLVTFDNAKRRAVR